MKKLFALLALAFAVYACQMPQITNESIETAIKEGNFTQAEQMIKLKIATEDLTPGEVWDLDAKIQVTRKLAREFADFYIPLDGLMAQAYVDKGASHWSDDGVHPNENGAKFIAALYAEAFEKINL